MREYSSLNYKDGINLFCSGYDFAIDSEESVIIDLSNVSDIELIEELKRRL